MIPGPKYCGSSGPDTRRHARKHPGPAPAESLPPGRGTRPRPPSWSSSQASCTQSTLDWMVESLLSRRPHGSKVPHSGVARWSRRTRRPSWQTRCQAVSLISVRFRSARTAHRWCQAGPEVVRARATCCHCQTTVCVDVYQNNRMRLSGISAVGDTDPRNRPCLPVSGHAQ